MLAAPKHYPAAAELHEVPFYPQEEYQCGPAALAMVLNWSGLTVTPEDLTPQVYLPARQGSLQPEMLAATRRYGRVAYVLQPRLRDLMTEVAAGHPVVVLQNLAFSWYPKWHYAVVVGVDPAADQVVLRSGIEQRHVVPLKLFERTGRRGGYWAMVVLPPQRLPATAEERPYLNVVAALERHGDPAQAMAAYGRALTRWPQSLGGWIGLGNTRYALGDKQGAAEAFARAVAAHPESAAAHNNLAQALADLGRFDEAEAAARRALEIGGPLTSTYQETLTEIRARSRRRQ